MDEDISVVLWIISHFYVVNNGVADLTYAVDFTFLTLASFVDAAPAEWNKLPQATDPHH